MVWVCTCNHNRMACPLHCGTQWYGATYTVTSAAWECPRCKAMNAPHVDQCKCQPISLLAGGTVTTTSDEVKWGGSD